VNKFEKVQLESSPNPVNRRSKIQMALLCRTFIEGAEQSALYVDKVKLALATGVLMPLMAKSKPYQKIASSTGFVWTYAPDMYGAEAFNLGRSYQTVDSKLKCNTLDFSERGWSAADCWSIARGTQQAAIVPRALFVNCH
jgi:hypothetical protein